MPPVSKTHHLAVVRQDNGELAEEIHQHAGAAGGTGTAGEDAGPGGSTGTAGSADDGQLVDEQSEQSFPASDAPSTWSDGWARHRQRDERVVQTAPVAEVPELPHPAAPVPGTLPR